MFHRLFASGQSFFLREREVLAAFVTSRLLIWLLGWAAFYWIKHGDYQVFPASSPWLLFYRWDAFWYARIVQHGYDFAPAAQSSVAFFPLLPLCISLLRLVTGMGTALAGFLISNLALLTAVIFLRRLVELDFPAPSRVPQRTAWLLLLCPMTFFHSAVYTESLFLMLSVAALFFARKRLWASAGLAAALLTATHARGVFILVPLLWEALVEAREEHPEITGSRIFRSRWWLLMAPSGLLMFTTYLQLRFGDAFAFLHAQAAFHRELATPWEGMEIATRYPVPYNYLLVGSAMGALGLLILGFGKRIRLSYQLYAAGILVLCLSTAIWESVPRYLSVVFPFYMTLAVATARSEATYVMVLAASTGLMTICLSLFVCGYFMT